MNVRALQVPCRSHREAVTSIAMSNAKRLQRSEVAPMSNAKRLP